MDTRGEINLRVLQQHDSSISSILKQSPYVVLYSYSVAEESWSKLPYEGSLFVYEMKDGTCGYRILNRLSLDCFARTLSSAEDVMETEGYVIHRSDQDIWGIWIWDGEDRNNIYAAMRNAAQLSENAALRGPSHPAKEPILPESEAVPDIPSRKQTWTPTTILQNS